LRGAAGQGPTLSNDKNGTLGVTMLSSDAVGDSCQHHGRVTASREPGLRPVSQGHAWPAVLRVARPRVAPGARKPLPVPTSTAATVCRGSALTVLRPTACTPPCGCPGRSHEPLLIHRPQLRAVVRRAGSQDRSAGQAGRVSQGGCQRRPRNGIAVGSGGRAVEPRARAAGRQLRVQTRSGPTPRASHAPPRLAMDAEEDSEDVVLEEEWELDQRHESGPPPAGPRSSARDITVTLEEGGTCVLSGCRPPGAGAWIGRPRPHEAHAVQSLGARVQTRRPPRTGGAGPPSTPRSSACRRSWCTAATP
jgi:hypothetical protein